MSDIKKQLSSGVLYTAIAKYVGVLMTIVISGVLSHILTPADYGLVVPVTVLVAFFTILGDAGIGPVVIQYKSLSLSDTNSIFTFTILLGGLLSLLFFLSSWFIADVYASATLIPLCQLMSLSLFFSCANVVPNALLYKNKQFRYLAFRSLTVQLLSGLIAIAFAFLGGGCYALVIQSLISGICLFIISYRKQPLKFSPFHLDWSPLKVVSSFLSYQFMFNVVNYFSVNLDKLLINIYLGPSALGYYDKSYKLMQMPLQNIPFVITPVMHPIFSEMQNDLHKMCVYYSKVVRFLAFVGFPLSVFLYFSGSDLIYIIFGDQWAASVPVFKILALACGFQSILSTSGSIFQSSGNTNYLFLSGLLSSITVVSALFIGLFYYKDIEYIGLFLLFAFIVNFIQTYILMYHFLFKTSMLFFLKQLVSPFCLSILLAVFFYFFMPVLQINAFLALGAKIIIALIVCGAYIQLTKEYDVCAKIDKFIIRNKK